MIRAIVILFLAVLQPVSAGNAYAANAEEARQFVDAVGKKVVTIVNSGAADKQSQLTQMFTENVDMDWMGKFVLGAAWNQATEDQRNRYLQAYRQYLLARYTANFADYAGSQYTITGAKPFSEGQFIVSMSVNAPKAEDTEVQAGYRVRTAENGQFKIIDIIIEGVSLLTTERSEFTSVVQKQSVDKLIEQLQSKASNVGKS